MRKILIICKVLLIVQLYIFAHQSSPADSKYSVKYKLKEGDVLTYAQVYEVKSQIYPDREEKYHLQIEWTVKIGVVAHKNSFYHLAIQYNRKKLNLVNKTSLERSFGKELIEDLFYTLNNFDRNFAQYVVIDEWGKNINGSFYFNEMPTIFHALVSRIFHLPESALKIKESYFREDEEKLRVTFSGIENTEMGECFVFEGDFTAGKARLLINKNLGIPDLMMFSAQYLLFERLKSEKFLMLFVDRKNSKWEEMLHDQELNKALLLSSLGQETLFCNRGIIENFLKSDDKIKQNLAIAYCSLKGIPEGLDLTDYLNLNNPTVRFNAAKAIFKFRKDRAPLEALISDKDIQVRLRVENFLARSSYLLSKKNFKLFKTVQDFVYSEEYSHKNISVDISEAREVLKFMKPENNLVGGCYRHFIRDKETGILRPYYVYLPEDYDPAELYPMITYLGGGNGRGDTAFKTIYQELKISNDLSNYILFVPQAQGMWWHEEVEKVFNQLLPRILRSYSIDTNRVYIAGSSNGGMGTFFYSTHHPDRFAAIATIMGHPAVKHRPPETEQDREVLENLRNTAIYMVHGEKDNLVTPGGDRRAYKKLSKLNYRIEYEELSGRAHDISFRESKHKIIQLFKTNQRNTHPEKVELVMNFPQYNRSYWIRVDKTRRLPARVSAKIKGNNVDIMTKGVQHLTIFLDEGLVDLTKETIIKINRKEVYRAHPSPSLECLLSSAREKNDAQLSYSIALAFEVD